MTKYLVCPECNHRVYNLTCKTCKREWKSEKAFHMFWHRAYKGAANKFLADEKNSANLFSAVELLHIAYRQLKAAEEAEK